MHFSTTVRNGRLDALWWLALGSLALLGGLIALLSWNPRTSSAQAPLVLFCAAGIKGPVEAVAREYEQKTGIQVQVQYGGSHDLLAKLKIAPRADLYLPADDSYVDLAREDQLLAETIPLASMRPVVVVRENNPKGFRSLQDLLARSAKFSFANPEAAAIGKLAKEALISSKLWHNFSSCILVYKPTVNDVAADVAVGAVDAGVVWDVTVQQVEGLQILPASALEGKSSMLSICVLRSSDQGNAALHFARYLSARDAGLLQFQSRGFRVQEGDTWVDTPTIRLYAGAMLKPAIQRTLDAFQDREGVEIKTVYNGCGILVAQMEAQRKNLENGPDAYFACDQEFMTQVQDLFGPPLTVSQNQLVLLVHKNNPNKIFRLKDLTRPSLKVGVGHEKQCALGVITQETLRQSKLREDVMKNVVVQVPSGDALVNSMLIGSLDAAVVYISNAAGHADRFDAYPINIPCAFAEQPFAIARRTQHKQLLARLRDALLSQESQQLFRDNGFTWKGKAN